jgi:hypothetical protein
MAQRDKDELARALGGVAGGDEADGGNSAAAPPPARAGKLRPAAPEQVAGTPRLVPARPIVPPGAVPTLPRSNRPASPSAPAQGPAVPSAHVPSAHVPSRPASPIRPAVPSLPVSPSSSAIEDATAATQEAAAVNDDDLVMIPAPSAEVFAHTHHAAQTHAPRLATIKSLDARRTVIPILLTIAAVLVATSTLRLLTSPNTPLSTLPRWIAWAGYTIAGLLFAVAILNVLYVRNELARADSGSARRV